MSGIKIKMRERKKMKASTYIKTGVISTVVYVTFAFGLIGICGVAQFSQSQSPVAANAAYQFSQLTLQSDRQALPQRKSI